ncbi:MAG: DNA-protecting protein DprA [Oscillospiraceae bacterium]|nr:DNA-protecting protein DprA [Oscillospiraceae bacterium]
MNRYDIWLSVVLGACCSNGRAIHESGLRPKEIYDNRSNLKRYGVFSERQSEKAAETSLEDVEGIFRKHLENEIDSINFSDERFPHRLKTIAYAPVVLFYKGDISLLDAQYTVSIVGSRHINGEGEKACELISSGVAQSGAVVISGLAQGADSIAHKSCVEAGGRTVAFAGVPLDEYFPKFNEKFQKELEKNHLVVSEYHCGYEYHRSNFVNRNRLIAAAGDALCLIQAKKKSGSLLTVNYAVEADKPVFTVPGGIFSPAYEGSNRLLVTGRAMAVTDASQIMEYLGAQQTDIKTEKKNRPEISDLAKTVLTVMDGAMFPNRITKAAAYPAGLVKAALTELEITGYIHKTDTGEYIRCD